MKFFLLINVKMPTTVGILTFKGRKNSLLSFLSLQKAEFLGIFSSPGRSPGRAIVLPLASALVLAKSLTLKFLCDGQGAVRPAILSL